MASTPASRRAHWDTAREGIGPTTPVGRFQRLLDAAESADERKQLLEAGEGTGRCEGRMAAAGPGDRLVSLVGRGAPAAAASW